MARYKKPKPVGPAQKLARSILSGILYGLFASLKTLRFKDVPELEHPCVLAVFHDELLPLTYYYAPGKRGDYASIASQNHFGYSISKVMESYGYEMTLGSQSKGGKDAFFKLLRAAKKGKTIAFTVDGSRGPRHEMKPGALLLARKSGLPLYLMRAEYKGWRITSSWDKFKIPLPFGQVRIKAELFPLDDKADIDELVSKAERRLKELSADDFHASKIS